MSAENPNEQLPQGPEQKEWQGQGWEYLVLSLHQDQVQNVVGAMRAKEGSKGLFKRAEAVSPVVKHYQEKLESLKKDISWMTISEFLNFLGSDGWEAISVAPNRSGSGDGPPLLILKRPLL